MELIYLCFYYYFMRIFPMLVHSIYLTSIRNYLVIFYRTERLYVCSSTAQAVAAAVIKTFVSTVVHRIELNSECENSNLTYLIFKES